MQGLRSHLLTVLLCLPAACADGPRYHELSREVLRDRIAGAWVGQMAGVSWAALLEFWYLGAIIPDDKVIAWTPALLDTAFLQDDLYVEIPFLRVLAERGTAARVEDFAVAFAATEYALWHANLAGRDNLRAGLGPFEAGHYRHNRHADDIDWQIETDFAGIVSPGLPRAALDIAWRAGHLMNHGDGVYGGAWVAAMHARAFVARDLDEVIAAGLEAIPAESRFRQTLDDVVRWSRENPGDWTRVWQLLEDKWAGTDRCPDGAGKPFNIDAKLNAAYVLIGLLYGGGDLERSMRIAMRCGQDCDCNASTVGSILGNLVGLSGIPEPFRSPIDENATFSHTEVTLAQALQMSEQVAASVVRAAGGESDGELWRIPVQERPRLVLEQWLDEDPPPPGLTIGLERQQGRRVTLRAVAEPAPGHGPAEIQWNFGDFDMGFGERVEHAFREPGAYQVVCTAADARGTSAFRTLDVIVP
ncbi:MAG: PKD domain-containing protein [Myxococcales bacterium]|nr:PKD domain-containing protein [Myxococcales bacterium]